MTEFPGKQIVPSKEHRSVEETQVTTTKSKTVPNLLSEDDSMVARQYKSQEAVNDALSNSLILQNIFTMLNHRDLETCSNVCQNWRSVADHVVSSHYKILLVTHRSFPSSSSTTTDTIFVIKEMARYSRKRFAKYMLDFKETALQLNNVLLSHKVTIDLVIRENYETVKDTLNDFLSQFGPFVVSLAFVWTNEFHVNAFNQFLLKRLPNLKKLDCSYLFLKQDTPMVLNFDPDQHIQYKHDKLRKICCRDTNCMEIGSFLALLKAAPNLEEILELPIDLLETIVVVGLGSLIKSIDVSQLWDDGDALITAFKNFRQLQPKLISFPLIDVNKYFTRWTLTSTLRSLVFATLQSSSQSLKSLNVHSARKSDVQPVPPLEELRTLELHDDVGGEYNEFFFGSKEISVVEMFPSLKEICISFNLNDTLLNRYFPENIISPWGWKIRILKLEKIASSTLPLLQKRFPSVHKLKLTVPTSEIAQLLLQLEELWPKLNSLEIILLYGYVPAGSVLSFCSDNERPVRLESAFTGLPEELVYKLEDPSLRKNFTHKEIQRFKEGSTIRKLRELKELKLNYEYCDLKGESVGKLTQLTLANEFGFHLLPQLTVTLKIPLLQRDAHAIKAALQPLAQCENIQIDDKNFYVI